MTLLSCICRPPYNENLWLWKGLPDFLIISSRDKTDPEEINFTRELHCVLFNNAVTLFSSCIIKENFLIIYLSLFKKLPERYSFDIVPYFHF